MRNPLLAAACLGALLPLATAAIAQDAGRTDGFDNAQTQIYNQPSYYAPKQNGGSWWAQYQIERRALRKADGGSLTAAHRAYLAERMRLYRRANI